MSIEKPGRRAKEGFDSTRKKTPLEKLLVWADFLEAAHRNDHSQDGLGEIQFITISDVMADLLVNDLRSAAGAKIRKEQKQTRTGRSRYARVVPSKAKNKKITQQSPAQRPT